KRSDAAPSGFGGGRGAAPDPSSLSADLDLDRVVLLGLAGVAAIAVDAAEHRLDCVVLLGIAGVVAPAQGCTTTWVKPGEDQALASRDEKLCELEATKASAIGDTANRRAAVGDMAYRRR